jgi:multiple sugar transport system ATP-binding protein
LAKVLLKNITKSFVEGIASTANDETGSSTNLANTGSSQPARPVLDDINLTVEDGEFMVLVGPSGCGKSTLLRLISGLESLTNGDIWVGDRTVSNLPPKQRDIAMVFQSYALYPHLSVYDNLAFGLRRTRLTPQSVGQEDANQEDANIDVTSSDVINPDVTSGNPVEIAKDRSSRPAWLESLLVGLTRQLPKAFRYQSAAERTIARRVQSVAQMLQIETLLHRLPKQLSGGQKQRVALGRAMARNPQVFLMDEPLSNLDAKLRTETRAQIVALQRQLGTTTIYVTHDQTEAMTMGDRIAVMNQGKLQQVAPPLELYRRPANRFVAAFIGSPPMNFLAVTLRANQIIHPAFTLALPAQWQAVLAPYNDQPLTLGIRPEHIAVGQQPGAFPVTVAQIEALGSETFVTAKLSSPLESISDSLPLQIRLSAEQVVEIGSILQVIFPLDQIHLFDPHTELAIRPKP